MDSMEADEELEYDPTAYDALHAWALEWPCLSFDIIRDELGDNRSHFPHSLFAVAGGGVNNNQLDRRCSSSSCASSSSSSSSSVRMYAHTP